LKLFTNDLIFHFNEKNNFYFLSGKIIENFTLDKAFIMNQNSVAKLFINAMQQNYYLPEGKEAIKNSCFDIEPGYYELNSGNSTVSGIFTKAWRINPTNKEYPYACINDMNSTIICYDNGIRD